MIPQYNKINLLLFGIFLIPYASTLKTGNIQGSGGELEQIQPPIEIDNATQMMYFFNGIYSDNVDQANIFCNSIGMKLLSIDDDARMKFLVEKIPSYIVGASTTEKFIWTSGLYLANENGSIWRSTGRPVYPKMEFLPTGEGIYVMATFTTNAGKIDLSYENKSKPGHAICQSKIV